MQVWGRFIPFTCGRKLIWLSIGATMLPWSFRIIDHRGVVTFDPVAALAYLQLGRALVMAGDTLKAKAAYAAFLTLWKKGDSDLPVRIKQRRSTRNYSGLVRRACTLDLTVPKIQIDAGAYPAANAAAWSRAAIRAHGSSCVERARQSFGHRDAENITTILED